MIEKKLRRAEILLNAYLVDRNPLLLRRKYHLLPLTPAGDRSLLAVFSFILSPSFHGG